MEFEEYDGLEQHHVKYLEIDGEDEITLVTPEEHTQIHLNSEREVIPARIVDAAHQRSPRRKAWVHSEAGKVARLRYDQSDKGRALQKRARNSDKGKATDKRRRQYLQSIHFSESHGTGTLLWERIQFNTKTGTVNYFSGFLGTTSKLPVINEK